MAKQTCVTSYKAALEVAHTLTAIDLGETAWQLSLQQTMNGAAIAKDSNWEQAPLQALFSTELAIFKTLQGQEWFAPNIADQVANLQRILAAIK